MINSSPLFVYLNEPSIHIPAVAGTVAWHVNVPCAGGVTIVIGNRSLSSSASASISLALMPLAASISVNVSSSRV